MHEDEDEHLTDAWRETQRATIARYLADQGCKHGEIAEWPAYNVAPHAGLWAVQSIVHPDLIGWWVVAGDCPTDYVDGVGLPHPRDALRHFGRSWLQLSAAMSRGETLPSVHVGTPETRTSLAPLLERRARRLLDGAESNYWDGEDEDT